MKTRKLIKCPRCKKPATELIEVWTSSTIQFDVSKETGLWDGEDGYMEPGEPDCVEGKCNRCNHQWRLRGIGQITDVKYVVI